MSCPDGCGKQAVGQTQSNQWNDTDSHMAESVTRHVQNPLVVKLQLLICGYTAGESSNPTNSLPEKAEQDQYVLRVVESLHRYRATLPLVIPHPLVVGR